MYETPVSANVYCARYERYTLTIGIKLEQWLRVYRVKRETVIGVQCASEIRGRVRARASATPRIDFNLIRDHLKMDVNSTYLARPCQVRY